MRLGLPSSHAVQKCPRLPSLSVTRPPGEAGDGGGGPQRSAVLIPGSDLNAIKHGYRCLTASGEANQCWGQQDPRSRF